MAGALESGDVSQQGLLLLRELAFEIVMIVLMAIIAVAITREILNPVRRPSFLRFALGPAEFRVVGGLIALFFLMIIFIIILLIVGLVIGFAAGAVLPAAGAAAGSKGTAGIGALAGVVGFFGLVYIMVRLGFLLVPAVAMESGFGLERSWKLTQGNFWRIVAIVLATLLPILIVTLIIDLTILGPDFLNPHLELAHDPAAQMRHSADQMRQMSAHLPLMMGIGFLLAPFTYGMTFAPAAFAYRALTGKAQLPQA
jgi:MFS family permease